MKQRIGIFSGTFDPIHAGHIAFALESIRAAKLDKVYFLVEMKPRYKAGVTHYAHRVAMLEIALRPFTKLEVLNLPDKQFSVNKTLPRLRRILPDVDLYMLVGSDVLKVLNSEDIGKTWPGYQVLLDLVTLVAGVRSDTDIKENEQLMSKIQPSGIIVSTDKHHMSSRNIRRAIRKGDSNSGLFASLKHYVDSNWLYVSVDPNNSR